MLWFYLSASAVLFFAFCNLIQRKVSLDSEDPRVLSIVFNVTAASMAITYFLIWGHPTQVSLPTDKSAWIYLGIAALSFGLCERYRFYVAKLLDASR